MTKSSFEHTALSAGQIRLLTLDKTEGEISCSISAYDFQKCPAYYTLSYAWGPPPPEHEILVNGHAFVIRENLYECLSSLERRPQSPSDDNLGLEVDSWGNLTGEEADADINEPEVSLFWIDQLCIDQTNITEKSAQVSIMDQIYTRAKETIIWVGKPNMFEHPTMCEPLDGSVYTGEEEVYLDDLEDIYRIFAKPYWTRLWIVQEVLLSSRLTVRYGHESYSWGLFETMARELARMLNHGADGKNLARHQDTIASRRMGVFRGLPDAPACLLNDKWSDTSSELNPGRRMSDVLNRFAQQECEALVDKVFALQSLLRPHARIEIDYSLKREELLYKVVDKLARFEGDDLFEDEQLDVFLALRLALKVPATKACSERIAEIVFGHVTRRLETIGEHLSLEEQELGLSWYLRYLENPGPTHIPSEYRVNDFQRVPYKQLMFNRLVKKVRPRERPEN